MRNVGSYTGSEKGDHIGGNRSGEASSASQDWAGSTCQRLNHSSRWPLWCTMLQQEGWHSCSFNPQQRYRLAAGWSGLGLVAIFFGNLHHGLSTYSWFFIIDLRVFRYCLAAKCGSIMRIHDTQDLVWNLGHLCHILGHPRIYHQSCMHCEGYFSLRRCHVEASSYLRSSCEWHFQHTQGHTPNFSAEESFPLPCLALESFCAFSGTEPDILILYC